MVRRNQHIVAALHLLHACGKIKNVQRHYKMTLKNICVACITVSIHCAPEMSEIDCIGRIESFWPRFVRGWWVFWHVFL